MCRANSLSIKPTLGLRILESSVLKKLVGSDISDIGREVRNAHFCFVSPKPAPYPYIISISSHLANTIGLDLHNDTNYEIFCNVVSGNVTLPGLNSPYATIYGGNSFGQWHGQLGY